MFRRKSKVVEGHCGRQVSVRDIASIEEEADGEAEEEEKQKKKEKKSISEIIINLTINLLTWIIWWVPNNANKCQMGFNSVFKGLIKISFIILQLRAFI